MSAALLHFPTDPLAMVRRAVVAFDSGDIRGAFDVAGDVVHVASHPPSVRVAASLVVILALIGTHPHEARECLRSLLPALTDDVAD